MSRSVNRVELLGHLGKDAEVKFTPTGIQVASFSIATSRSWKPKDSSEWKEATDWHRCIFWRCENIRQFLTKGKQLFLTGRMQTRQYEHEGVTRYVTEVIVEELILLGGGASPDRGGGAYASSPGNSGGEDPQQGITEDDVPF